MITTVAFTTSGISASRDYPAINNLMKQDLKELISISKKIFVTDGANILYEYNRDKNTHPSIAVQKFPFTPIRPNTEEDNALCNYARAKRLEKIGLTSRITDFF